MQVIRADMTCLGFIFPEPKARVIYNPDRSYISPYNLHKSYITNNIYWAIRCVVCTLFHLNIQVVLWNPLPDVFWQCFRY